MIFRVALVILVMLMAVAAALADSTINTTLPIQGVPYNAAPIRDNFGAAANDINKLQNMNIGVDPPSAPVYGTLWLQQPESGTTYILKIWVNSASQWVAIASIDGTAGYWMPPVGGGLLPSLVSAATTDLGSVPQAALYVTGNQSIGSLGNSAPPGQLKFVTFTGTATLVYNVTYMILPGSANITFAPGESAILVALGQGKWRMLNTVGGDVVACDLFTDSTNGCVPASGGGTTNYLRADGTWGTPSPPLACTDLTDDGTACVANTGASGHTLPFLDGVNTWSGTNSFSTVYGNSRTVAGTTDTLSGNDCGKTVIYTSGTPVTVTTFANAVTGTSICAIALQQQGAGSVVVTPGVGATSVSAHACTKTFGQYASIGVMVQPNNPSQWNILGDCLP